MIGKGKHSTRQANLHRGLGKLTERLMAQTPTPLQPCPFCGGEAAPGKSTITRDRDSEGNKGTFTGYFVSCIYCSADNQGIAEGWKTPELAAEKWNRRAVRSETACRDSYDRLLGFVRQVARGNKFADRDTAETILREIGEESK